MVLERKEKKIVINAINNLGRRVSAADIASKTGLPLASATLALNQIAAETSGHMQVSKAGDIAYQFPIAYQSAYISHGVRRFFEQFLVRALEIGFFLLRISFGIMLILSLLSIVLIFFVIMSARSQSRDNDDFAIDLDFFDWMILRDLLFWQLDDLSYGYTDQRDNKPTNFLYNCFSFLFGDGNPNRDLDERRWQMIANLIRQKKAVVTTEQLAPYIGNDPSDEDAVLPVLVRFDGRPAVTESGNIVYLFPSLQAQAAGNISNSLPPYLNIFRWQFSKVEQTSLIWVVLLAAVNFFGSWYLYISAAQYSTLAFLSPLLTVLVAYGTLFIAIPFARYISICLINQRIVKGNQLRESYARLLSHPEQRLINKLNEAKEMAVAARPIDDVVYDTNKDILEQEFPTISNS